MCFHFFSLYLLLPHTQFLYFKDEEHLFEGKDPDSYWDDFALVATDLLERLQLGISGRNTPCEISDDEAAEVNAPKHW